MTYALIQWGGLVAGQRPRTVLAYVFDTPSGHIKADILDQETGKSKYKRPRFIESSDILHRFDGRHLPKMVTIKTAKLMLPIVQENDGRFDVADTVAS